MSKLLYVADAVSHTGFARVTHNVVPQLIARGWDVDVLGINYYGDPHAYPFKIYPAIARDSNVFGFDRIRFLADELVKPDVILINNDPWLIGEYARRLTRDDGRLQYRIVSYIPVDAENMKPEFVAPINHTQAAIFYTEFGRGVAQAAGLSTTSAVIPHGVDPDVYLPLDRARAREILGLDQILDPDAFVIGNINRNQPRKRFDLTMLSFKYWLDHYKPDRPVHLYFHCAVKDVGWDILQFAQYLGIEPNIITANNTTQFGVAQKYMSAVYSSCDLQITTTQGEGWGLTQMEGMSCGVPQIATNYAAEAEWMADAAAMVDPAMMITNDGGANTLGALVNPIDVAAAIDRLYRSPDERRELSEAGRALVQQDCFSWAKIGEQFDFVLRNAMEGSGEDAESHDDIGQPQRGANDDPARPR